MSMMDLPQGAYERAFGHASPRIRGREVLRAAPGRRHDSVRIESISMGVMPEQAAEWNRDWGHLGVWFDQRTGHAVFENRRAKLRYMRATGYHDRDEICG